MRIALVDDNDLDLLINEKLILNAYPNAHVKVYTQGQKLIDDLAGSATPAIPDIVVTDLKMPGLSGAEIVIEFFKLFPDAGTKILMLSASVSYEDEELVSRLDNRVRIMEKPLDPSVLPEL